MLKIYGGFLCDQNWIEGQIWSIIKHWGTMNVFYPFNNNHLWKVISRPISLIYNIVLFICSYTVKCQCWLITCLQDMLEIREITGWFEIFTTWENDGLSSLDLRTKFYVPHTRSSPGGSILNSVKIGHVDEPDF